MALDTLEQTLPKGKPTGKDRNWPVGTGPRGGFGCNRKQRRPRKEKSCQRYLVATMGKSEGEEGEAGRGDPKENEITPYQQVEVPDS